uniref:Succinate dehydrogenase subunit D n=1 Tax=Candidatus Kentrum sp. TUN TaxID=2126343 RepID=A0A450ZQR4_9GAMM|nr:MAG: succinate dehydrogenase subunit D [Candidatus Kentron sp. TUN]VFK54145.1 MAG: succinate dehydrogenase subunit D [Candidatus Kentron sp. TUN]VFK56172.1 MAG: succinate dehydrogenase subunit D [Candidatus Kentron sp. TUN]
MAQSNKISNKPIVWGFFAGGGTLTAFLTPVLVLVTLLAAFGNVPEALSYQAMQEFTSHWLGKLIFFFVIFLSLWHAAHRFRVTIHDFGVRADGLVAVLAYLIAGVGTILAIWYLLSV